MELGSQIFGAFTERVSEPLQILAIGGSGGGGASGFKLVLYLLAAGLAIGVLLVTIDAYYPFLPINPVSGPSALARRSKTFWTGLDYDAQNLMVPASASPITTATDYSVSVQILLQDTRTISSAAAGRYRHILHRGTNPCNLSVTFPGPTGHNDIQPGDIPDAPPSYLETGLPPFMNPGIMLDPVTNDLHVFVHTKGQEGGGGGGGGSSSSVLWLESATIEDLPLNTPLTIGVVLTGQTLEVYLNCRLYSTTLLKGQPFLSNAELNAWFGRACAFPFVGAIQNLTLWGAPLNSGDYLQVCRGADFGKVSLSPIALSFGSGSCSASSAAPAPTTKHS